VLHRFKLDEACTVVVALTHRRQVIPYHRKFNFNSWITKKMQSGFFIFVKAEKAQFNE
jgi:hypothetical protein